MPYLDLLDELRNLSKLKYNWYSIAETIEKIKGNFSGNQYLSRRIREASDACGYSVNTVNRMLAVRHFFNSVKIHVPSLEGIDPNTLSFSNIEVAKRLHNVNPEKSYAVLEDVLKGNVTFRELRHIYSHAVCDNISVASPHQTAKMESRDFETAALKAINSAYNELFGAKVKLSYERLRLVNISVDAVAYKIDDAIGVPSFGIELFYAREQKHISAGFCNLLNRVIFSCNFFECFWVVLSSNVGENRLNKLIKILDVLECRSVGVAVLSWGDEIPVTDKGLLKIVRPPTGVPSQDWRGKLNELRAIR